jgi:hypothetical protein
MDLYGKLQQEIHQTKAFASGKEAAPNIVRTADMLMLALTAR